MKITRTTWLILALGVFVIAFASLYVVYSRESNRHKDLKSSLARVEARYPQLVSQIKTLESQLAQRQSDLTAALSNLAKARAKFPASVQSSDYYPRLLAIAGDCELSVLTLTSSAPRQEKAGTLTYLVTNFDISVKGEMERILDFIHTLATRDDFASAAITVVSVNIPAPPTGKGGTTANPQATLSLDVYAYPGE